MESGQIQKDDNMRITISIGLTASFLVLIFSLHNILPAEISPIYQVIRYIVYFYFAIICILFIGFLLTKAASLKYKNKNNIGVLDIHIPPGLSKFFFDFGVEYSLYSPIGATTVVYLSYMPQWLMNTFALNDLVSFIVTFIIYIIAFIAFYMPIDYFINHKKRGHQ